MEEIEKEKLLSLCPMWKNYYYMCKGIVSISNALIYLYYVS